MGDLEYLALAYGIMWLGVLVYVFRLSRHAHDLRRELELLREVLGREPEEVEAGETPAARA